jgi:hypothetical protein
MNNELIWTEEKGVWKAEGMGGFSYQIEHYGGFFQMALWKDRGLIGRMQDEHRNHSTKRAQIHNAALCAIRDEARPNSASRYENRQMTPSLATDWATSHDLKHTVYPGGDITFDCPLCGSGRIVMHGENQWWFCMGNLLCYAKGESVAELEKRMKEKKL